MPKVDMDMATGTLAVWHVSEGDEVARGAPLFDIETDKAAMEVESPASGRLLHVRARPGEVIPVGEAIAWIYAPDEVAGEPPGPAAAKPEPDAALSAPEPAEATLAQALRPAASAPAPVASGTVAAADPGHAESHSGHAATTVPQPDPAAPEADRAEAATGTGPDAVRATPAARHTARVAGLLLAEILGSGPNGRVQRADVEAAAAAASRQAGAQTVAMLTNAVRPEDGSTPPAGLVETPDAARAEDGPPRPAGLVDTPAVRLEDCPPAKATLVARSGAARASEAAGELALTRRPGRGVPLLLLHGFAADSTGWRPLERALPADLPLIRIDLPFHGRSFRREPDRPVHDFAALSRAVVEAFDRLDGDEVHLLGHSLGGAVALALADVRPRQIATLTLMSPAGLGPEIDGPALLGIARASREDSLAPWLKQLPADPAVISWDYVKAAMHARSDPALRDAQLALADALFPDGVQAFDLHAALARFDAPSAIIWGRDDRIIPWRHALAAGGETALHLLPGIGHIAHVERPGLVARIVAGMCR